MSDNTITRTQPMQPLEDSGVVTNPSPVHPTPVAVFFYLPHIHIHVYTAHYEKHIIRVKKNIVR